MREIKFRGKAECGIEELEKQGFKHENGWIYGTYLDGYIVNGVVESTDEYIALEEWCPIKIETVGQYTGLKDKNGKEIYEGDIIEKTYYSYHQPECSELFEIKYEGLSFHFEHIKGNTFHLPFTEDIEVIGNIHDNPELLEVV